MTQNILSAFVAALVGFFTAISIEAVKTFWFERKMKNDEREHQKMQSLLSFYAPSGIENNLPPVARLLISSPSETVRLENIDLENSQLVVDCKDILKDVENPSLWENVFKPRRFLFWKLPPKGLMPVLRTYYKPVPNENISEKPEFANVWQTKEDVAWLGRITTIGRRKNNDICLQPKENLISRQHAVIRFEESSYILYNLSITNYIFVNGDKIEFHHELKNNDVIEMTPYYMIFEQRSKIVDEK